FQHFILAHGRSGPIKFLIPRARARDTRMPKVSSRQDLTDAKVAALRRGLKRVEYPDTQVPGLRVGVQPSGSKVWALRTRASGTLQKITLGPVAKYPVEEAR